ncbi:hypothetical protein [Klebsiella variicola]|uniref:hypothetical protein n=1 Tax=Klebsiella variicola TaxID=244366 RepID=UPI0011578912|nr:hypothetical protein [Klebsiella variicola]
MTERNHDQTFSSLRRKLLLSGLALSLPAIAKEEFATLYFVPTPQHEKHHLPVRKRTAMDSVNATIFDRFSPFLMSAIHQPG